MKKNLFLMSLLASTASFSQVGINTTNPQNTFHVDGGKDNPTTGAPSQAQQANDVIITNDGKVGIGMTIPKSLLNISKKGNTTGINTSFVDGITITSDMNNAGLAGPGFYLEGANATVGQKLLKVNYSKNNSGNSFLNFQAVSDDATTGVKQIMSVYHNGNVGIGGDAQVTPPNEKLDVVDGNVRIRTINANIGNSNVDKLVVADSNGVLKTLPKPNPVLTGGDLTDAIPTEVNVTVTPAEGVKTQNLITFPFTLTQRSLVTFNYQLTFNIPGLSNGSLTNTMKIIRSYLTFTAGPIPLNQTFGFQVSPISAGNGRPGLFVHSAGDILLLEPGSYTVQLTGNVVNTVIAGDPDLSVNFGLASDRFTVIAMPVY